jgi:uncharacterized protein YyaL (SSP411 family)
MSQSEHPAPPPGKNRLAFEKSPYLLQHADNPVDWYAWGEEAFAEAARLDKPIFLSIGYATCHWCHVMEHESFEDAEVAALMNDAFVCIKVDREERPDIDNVYMTVCQMMTQRGGWPLTILMTPQKEPFFAGTYIPREGMLGFVPRVKALWQNERGKLVAEAGRVTAALRETVASASGEALGEKELDLAFEQLSTRFDDVHGGFGERPKFPTPHTLLFLLRYWDRSESAEALAMVEKTLEHMRRGGMYDHVGFGFHRYSTDERWFLPHFEKMLYDQALLAMAYTEAYQATGKDAYRRTAEEIFAYIERDMTSPEGAFHSAEDADSEGEEGKFYLWTADELREVLGEEDARLLAEVWGVQEDGNYREEAGGHRTGANILYLERPLDEAARAAGTDEAALSERIESMRRRLLEARAKRVRPLLDDKILADWNGLMIAALSLAARAFDEPAYAERAARAATFVTGTMAAPDGGLYHRYREGSAAVAGMVDDYAFVAWGLIELYEATFDVAWLERALGYTRLTLERFWDEEAGGFFFTPEDGEALIVRQKESYDGALPSGNSVAMLNLLRLGRMTADGDLERRATDVGRAFASTASSAPSVHTQMLAAVDFAAGPSHEVVIVGTPGAADTRALARALGRPFLPRKVVLFRPAGEAGSRVVKLAPYTRAQSAIEGTATAYVCRNYACELPTTEAARMLEMLDAR